MKRYPLYPQRRDVRYILFTKSKEEASVKPGFSYGEFHDFGYNVVKDPVSVHDLQTTILQLFGIAQE